MNSVSVDLGIYDVISLLSIHLNILTGYINILNYIKYFGLLYIYLFVLNLSEI